MTTDSSHTEPTFLVKIGGKRIRGTNRDLMKRLRTLPFKTRALIVCNNMGPNRQFVLAAVGLWQRYPMTSMHPGLRAMTEQCFAGFELGTDWEVDCRCSVGRHLINGAKLAQCVDTLGKPHRPDKPARIDVKRVVRP